MKLQNPLPMGMLVSILSAFMLIGTTFSVQAQYVSLNGGFETGTFSADTTWAGSPAVTLGSPGSGSTAVFPSLPFAPWLGGWAPNALNGVYWVNNSSTAYEGSKYLYISGVDTCYNLLYGYSGNYQGLTVGQQYTLTFHAASAQDLSGGATPVSQLFNVEWTDGSNPSTTTGYSLAANPAWSDTAQTTIPWETHSFVFTPTAANGIITFSTSLGTSSAWTLDGVDITPTPEPGSSLLICVGGALLITRRRRLSRARS